MGANTRSARFREKAAQLRALAEDAPNQDMRDFYDLMAEDYDRMADEADKQEPPEETKGKPSRGIVGEMGEDAEKAKAYRDRATELRAKAKTTSNRDAIEGMISVAVTYDLIADSLERIEATKRSLGILK